MLSIIIVNYKQPELLRLCLSSLRRVIAADFKHEIIVMDSAASPETRNVAVEDFKDIRYVPFKQNVGYTHMVNEGIAAAIGDTFFVINSDIIPLPGSIESMYSYLHTNPKVGLVGPGLLNFDGSPQQSCFRYYTPWTIIYRRTPLGRLPFAKQIIEKFYMKDRDLSQPTPADWLSGSALMGTVAAARKVGPMDSTMFLYMSDVDWPRRFWENGYQVHYYPMAQMYHYHHRHSRSWLGMFDALFNPQAHQHIKDAIRYFKKYGTREFTYIS